MPAGTGSILEVSGPSSPQYPISPVAGVGDAPDAPGDGVVVVTGPTTGFRISIV